MFTIKEYNEELNNSYDFSKNYINWKKYRKLLCNNYISYLENLDNCLIVGAGYLNDICIDVIAKNIKKISLLDIDTTAIKKGLKNYELDSKKFNIIEKDITNFDVDDFFNQVIYMLQVRDINGLKRYFDIVKSRSIKLDLNKKFDSIIISSIYTQILLMQYITLLNKLIKKEEFETYLEPFMALISSVISTINVNLLDNVQADGLVICFSDIFEFDVDDEQYRLIIENISNKDFMEEYYNNYITKYGHGLGSHGISDISTHINIKDSSWYIWPFDKKRKLIVNMIIGTKK